MLIRRFFVKSQRLPRFRHLYISMRFVLLSIFLLAFFITVPAQEKALTQAEYVKMLYGIQAKTTTKEDIVEALRRRGIAFRVTDGIRSLTRSKGKNDSELKRALEEAERRRADPESFTPASSAEAAAALEKATQNTIAAIEEMPDFVVKQYIRRSEAYAGTGNWRMLDNLIIAVSFSAEQGERYRVLAKDGVRLNRDTQSSYGGLDGATSGGEFVEDLQKIFKPESKTEFEYVTTDVVDGRRALVYDYRISLENNKFGGVGLKGPVYSSSPAGEKGRIWIDRENFRVVRIEYELTDIKPSFPVKAVTKTIEYGLVDIEGEKYLLPTISDFRGTVSGSGKLFEQRNVIRFRDYQKFGTDVFVGEAEVETTGDTTDADGDNIPDDDQP